jgi:glutamate/tyrosine decarboxylase-like PLP-dependent enzyme
MTKLSDPPLLERTRDHVVRYLDMLPGRRVAPLATREELLASLRMPLTDEGEAPAAVIDSLADAGEEGTLATAGPRFFGFVIGGTLPVGLAADWLTSAWDQNAGLYVTSPIASVVEDVAREWLLELFDLPREASVGFVTGCQMANYTALSSARHALLRRQGWDVEERGLCGAPPLRIIAGAEAHVTIHTSLRMLGFGTAAIRTVATDAQGRVRPDALEAAMRESDAPAIVCAQAGNVNTGAVDPLREVAAITHEHGAWLHVDSAFGLWGRASRDRRPLLEGIELADSWATDAHKWLNVPYDNGIAIVRDSASHRAAMTVSAAYLEQTSGVERDPVDWVPEFSRRARGLTVYAALRHLGRRGVESLVDNACARARQFAELLVRDRRVAVLNDVVLNQVLVRFGDSDALTREVIARVQREGTCWLAGTTWHEMAAMRISVSHWATSEEDVTRSAEAILRCLGEAAR